MTKEQKLRHALEYLMQGANGLPALTAIEGVLIPHMETAKAALDYCDQKKEGKEQPVEEDKLDFDTALNLDDSVTEDQRKEFIQLIIKASAKPLLFAYLSLKLNSKITASIVNEPTGDLFELTFYKVADKNNTVNPEWQQLQQPLEQPVEDKISKAIDFVKQRSQYEDNSGDKYVLDEVLEFLKSL